MNQTFLIVISGVIIFVVQKLISDLWIAPNLAFNTALTKIETLLVKSLSLYKYTHGNNNLVSSAGLSMDLDIIETRKNLNLATWELINAYHSLFFFEKIWRLKVIGIDMNKARHALLSLSVTLCSKDDWKQPSGKSLSYKEIEKAYKFLRMKKYFTDI